MNMLRLAAFTTTPRYLTVSTYFRYIPSNIKGAHVTLNRGPILIATDLTVAY